LAEVTPHTSPAAIRISKNGGIEDQDEVRGIFTPQERDI